MSLSVIIPASNEAAYIDACLRALLDSSGLAEMQVIVVANGCRDDTVARAEAHATGFAGRGWTLRVLDLDGIGKPAALDAGDRAAVYASRVYLDADVVISPALLSQLAEVLDVPQARYASGTPRVTARSRVTRAYARFWVRLPFVAQGVPGFGLYAVNGAGRARWDLFPQVISDDTYVRIQFTPDERVKVAAPYDWPMAEGLRNLVRVRRRQDQGVAELALLEPVLMGNEGKASPSKAWLIARLLRDPLAFVTYAAVTLLVRMGWGAQEGWVRGR
ncbi:glycosyltransferase family 2 protein [Pararhodobacter oceanensis]|uniref:glycosyltransferase family 2 protein n=1 Tax=Pararhodobacter oceanensis TaxID=2172121 RepID=UPI003A8F7201